jgi:hypothetical protein
MSYTAREKQENDTNEMWTRKDRIERGKRYETGLKVEMFLYCPKERKETAKQQIKERKEV